MMARRAVPTIDPTIAPARAPLLTPLLCDGRLDAVVVGVLDEKECITLADVVLGDTAEEELGVVRVGDVALVVVPYKGTDAEPYCSWRA